MGDWCGSKSGANENRKEIRAQRIEKVDSPFLGEKVVPAKNCDGDVSLFDMIFY